VVASHGMSMCLGCSANQNTYCRRNSGRVAARRGSKRAIIAVATQLVIIGYTCKKSQRNYEDLGGDYFDA